MTAVVSYYAPAPTRRVPERIRGDRPAAPRLRLTRRGRAVFTALAAVPLLIAGLVLGIGTSGAVATRDVASDSLTWITVDAGQSLWDLAAEIAPEEDPREFAAHVAAFNQLESTVIQPGQELALPPHYAQGTSSTGTP